jgi:hypothetical protein
MKKTEHRSVWVKKIVALSIHPMMLAFFLSFLIILLLPYHFPKYKAEILKKDKDFSGANYFWEDLEGDGISDHINFANYSVGKAALSVNLYPSGIVNSWDFRGQFPNNRDQFFTSGDFDENGKKEIYVFTISNDSIFLHCVSDFRSIKPAITNRFISLVGLVNGKSDPEFLSAQLDELNMDGFKELIFGINTGFSLHPRNVFAYDIHNNDLLRSPESGFQIQDMFQEDVTGEKRNEILLVGYAPGNIHNQETPFNDHSCWLMVLDNHLRFLFPPVEFPGRAGSIIPIKFNSPSASSSISLLWTSPEITRKYCFYKYSTKRKLILKKEINEIPRISGIGQPFTIHGDKKKNIYLPDMGNNLFLYDTLFKFIKKIHFDFTISGNPFFYDIDQDGKPEILLPINSQNQLAIFRSDLTDPVIVDVSMDSKKKTNLSSIKVVGKPSLLFIDSGNFQYTISYLPNPAYYTNWVIYFAIYITIFLFTLLVMRIQKVQLQKRYNVEKKITELQLKIVRNQMDPHFTMNAINSVIGAINRNDKESASDNLMHFSQMYRSLVLSSDKYKVSILEELTFTENYLKLEQFRFKGKLIYTFLIDDNVNKSWNIPKMVIQNPVENAVKHGLSNIDGKGILEIYLTNRNNQLIISITDNGIGRYEAAKSEEKSTGKGLQMMAQFYDLYYQITKIKIQSEIHDLQDEDGTPLGTKVSVTIPI